MKLVKLKKSADLVSCSFFLKFDLLSFLKTFTPESEFFCFQWIKRIQESPPA